MLYIDISKGISFPLLLKAIAYYDSKFIERISQCIHKDAQIFLEYRPLFKHAFEHNTIDGFCIELVNTVKEIKTINISSLQKSDSFIQDISKNMYWNAKGFVLDPEEVCIYISLAAYFSEHSVEIHFFSPGVNIHSSQYTLDILKGSSAVLKDTVPNVSPFCAEYLMSFGSFLTSIPMNIIEDWQQVNDPINTQLEAKVFSVKSAVYEEVVIIETNIDDMTPEVISGVMKLLIEKGALDVWISPITMKKNRQAFWFHIIVYPDKKDEFADFLLKETSTFGIRYSIKQRQILQRDIIEYKTVFGTIHLKRGFFEGKCLKAIPEFDDMNYISKIKKIPLSDLFLLVNAQIYKDFGIPNEQEYL